VNIQHDRTSAISEEAIFNDIQSCLPFPLAVSISGEVEYVDWENIRVLHDIGEITTQRLARNIITVEAASESLDAVAQIEWAISHEDGAAYIHWVHVSEPYRENGLGSQMWRIVLDSLIESVSVNWVFAEAFSKGGETLMQNTDFQRLTDFDTLAECPGPMTWYARPA